MKTDFPISEINAALSKLFEWVYDQNKNYIPFTTVAKISMLQCYDHFVTDGLSMPIEELSVSEKEDLVSECRRCNIPNTNEALIKASKILHVIRAIKLNT